MPSSLWKDFVNCPKRLKTLAPFLEKYLSKHKQGYIFDAALGIGCESIFLKMMGYKIISNEIDETLIQVATKSAKRQNIKLQITRLDWREISYPYKYNFFDGIFLLGNSLSCLNDINDINISLKNFYFSLKQGGTIIIDERNFPYIISHKNEILSGNFHYSGEYIYCGKSIKGIPIAISDKEIDFGYFQGIMFIGSLKMYPFKKGELKELLLEAGFKNVVEFSDFKPGYESRADFFIYIATK